MKAKLFFIHGFNTTSLVWRKAINICEPSIEVHFHDWNSYYSPSSTCSRILLNTFQAVSYGSCELAECLKLAEENIDEEADILFSKINSICGENELVMLVAHSMGTKILRQAIDRIATERPDIIIHFMTIAGIENSANFGCFDTKVQSGVNLFNPRDNIIKNYELIGEYSDAPIGRHGITYEDNIVNVKVDIEHSDYNKSYVFLNLFYLWTNQIMLKPSITNFDFNQTAPISSLLSFYPSISPSIFLPFYPFLLVLLPYYNLLPSEVIRKYLLSVK